MKFEMSSSLSRKTDVRKMTNFILAMKELLEFLHFNSIKYFSLAIFIGNIFVMEVRMVVVAPDAKNMPSACKCESPVFLLRDHPLDLLT